MENKKIKVLWYSDFLIPTGFGNVAEEIISRLQATGKYDIEVLGINYDGNPYNVPGSRYYHLKDIPVYPAIQINKIATRGMDMLGKEMLVNLLRDKEYDILFCLQDTFNMTDLKEAIEDLRKTSLFKYIFYFPVDGNLDKRWVENAIKVADFPVTYTTFALSEVQKISPELDVDIMYHGVDMKSFSPMTDEEKTAFKKSFFGISDPETIIVTNVNRNQPRKDLTRSLLAFKEFKKLHPNSILYLHCNMLDRAGLNLKSWMDKYLDDATNKAVLFPDMSKIGVRGLPKEYMRGIYACSDMLISTTLGEGWGLSTTEAMACKTPVIVPNNTSSTEIIGENDERGFLVRCGETPSDYFVQKLDNEVMRPLTDINDLVSKMCLVIEQPEIAKAKAEAAYEWIKDYTWDKIAEGWDIIFTKAYDERQETVKAILAEEKAKAEEEAHIEVEPAPEDDGTRPEPSDEE